MFLSTKMPINKGADKGIPDFKKDKKHSVALQEQKIIENVKLV